jgi:lipooligosaccharide transport system permease protein
MFKVWHRDLVVWSHYFFSSLVANLGEPFLYLLAIGYGLGRYVNSFSGMSYSEFIAPALVVVSVMNTASFETTFSSYTRMTVQKTFDAIAATPLSFRQIVWGEILWAATKACFSSMVIFLVVGAFGLIHSPWALGVVILCVLEGIVFSSLGMLMTALARSYDAFNYYFTLFISPMFLFSGTFFPLTGLPSWIYGVAWCLPLTHAVQGARELFAGPPGLTFLKSCLWLGIAAVLSSWVAVRKMERRLFV